MKRFVFLLGALVLTACDGSPIAASRSHLSEVISRKPTQVSEPRKLAECSGIFLAAAASVPDDKESEATFVKAGRLSLKQAIELGKTQSEPETKLNELGYNTMVEYLTRVNQDKKSGYKALYTGMEDCLNFIQQLPDENQRI